MDTATVFYILGGALVALALVTSFLGLRSEKFPGSSRALGGMLAGAAIIVVATGFFAVLNGEAELEAFEAELAAEEEGGAEEPTTSIDGAEVFVGYGCGQCHSLSDAGTTAQVGPSLDDALQGKKVEFVRTAIIDPNDFVEPGFSADIMPADYEAELSPEELEALVAYLAEVGGADG